MEAISVFRDERIWRWITNFWTFVTILYLVLNFLKGDAYEAFSAPFSIVYTGVLGIYAGTKEFDRWYELHDSRHPGEVFILLWTAVVFVLFAGSIYLGKGFAAAQEGVTVYIMVLSVFALTQKSKKLHRKHHEKKAARKK